MDALLVINYLNATADAEPEFGSHSFPAFVELSSVIDADPTVVLPAALPSEIDDGQGIVQAIDSIHAENVLLIVPSSDGLNEPDVVSNESQNELEYEPRTQHHLESTQALLVANRASVGTATPYDDVLGSLDLEDALDDIIADVLDARGHANVVHDIFADFEE
jgi:hypothetical protein